MESFQNLFAKKKAEIRAHVSRNPRYAEAPDPFQRKKVMIEIIARTVLNALGQHEEAFELYMQIINAFKSKKPRESSVTIERDAAIISGFAQIPEFVSNFQYVRDRVIEIMALNALVVDLLSQMTETERTFLTALDRNIMAATTAFCQLIAEDPTRVPKIAEVVDVIGEIDARIVRVLETPH